MLHWARQAPALRTRRSPQRRSLRALVTSLSSVVAVSLVAAVGCPAARAVRLVLLLFAWGVFAALIAYLFVPAFDLQPARIVRRLPRALGSRALALTFDDGPHPETTPALLEALARARVRATFFVVGERARRYPELVHRMVADGHTVGNHTQRHRLLVFRSDAQVEAEIAECQAALTPIVGAPPRLFRPPHGFKPIGLFAILRRYGLQMIAWQGAIRDTDAPGAQRIAARALSLARPGRILLLHDNPTTGGQTAQALPHIIAGCRARGLQLVALCDELQD